MTNQVIGVTIKGIGDFSDVVSNVGSVQKALTKLKLPDKLGDNLNKNITAFYKEYEKYQKKISEGIKTQGDYNQVEKSLNNMRNLYQAIGKDAQKLLKLDMKDLLDLDTGEFKKITSEITNIMKQIGNVKIDTTSFKKAVDDIRGVTKNTKISGDNGILNQIMGSIQTGQIADAKKQLQELQNYANKVAPRMLENGKQAPGTLSVDKYQQLTAAIAIMSNAFTQADAAMAPFIARENELQKELEETKQKAAQGIEKEFKDYGQATGEVEKLTDSLKRMHQEEFSFNREAQNIDRQIQSYFGLSQMIRKVGDIAKDAFATVKELDKAMTETAVVTNFSVGDMWNMLPTYTQQANQLGSTIKDVYDAATLYYQQGLNTNQAMGLANETLKMARIAGLDAADATNMMTAALRGFNMEINQASAQKINDVYSELAAITASDTKEIGSAMERTASIANSANMEFSTTSAFLAQMIETTREAPENLGTAMKTIVARFQEMKQDPTKLVDSEGVAMDVNKVDKALKTIGVNLTNTKGEFRDLDDVFLDISSKWDSLSQGQQRYIATIAAGSRQQSRFIAMMSNYERTMELVDAANNSAGASQRQFEKTLDSMSSKLNMLKNAWDQFTMGLMNNQILKFGVDALTEGFTVVNKFIDALSKLGKPFGLEGLNKSLLTLATTVGMLQFGKRASRGLIRGGVGWWKGETSLTEGFAQGWKQSGQSGLFGTQKGNQDFNKRIEEARNSGISGAKAYAMAWKQTLPKAGIKESLTNAFKIDTIKQNIQSNTAKGLLETLMPKEQISQEARDQFQYYMQEFQAGNINREDMPSLISGAISEIDQINVTDEVLDKMANMPDPTQEMGEGFGRLTSAIGKAGSSLQVFGSILQGTPLEPFGQILITVGTGLTALSGILAGTKIAFMENWAAALGLATGEDAVTFASIRAALASKGFAAGVASLGKAIWSTFWPLLAIAAVVGTVVAAYKMLDLAIVTNAEKLEAATDAAAAASEAYDSAKQETSELTDAIEQIKTNEDAFEGLVVGTAAFNEQLVTANDQIMELIKKYPMLNDYLTTDKNGVMHISDKGLEAVKEYQQQRQANASALNILQTADLNAEENKQKLDRLYQVKAGASQEDFKQSREEAKLLRQRIEAETQSAKLNAVHTALVGKEIGDQETISAILADQYDTRKNMVDLSGQNKHDLRQQYADYYGYKYDKSTKKMTDNEGNEVEIDDAVIKDAVKEITVIEDLQVDAGSLETAVNSINQAFSSGLDEDIEGSSTFIGDLLSHNVEANEDLIQSVIKNPQQLEDLVNNLSEKEIAAVLGVSENKVSSDIEQYKTQLTDKLKEDAQNIAETQAQAYTDLAGMMARATYGDADAVLDDVSKQDVIKQQLNNLKAEQRNTLAQIGSILQENVGAESTNAFLNQMTNIYTSGDENLINQTQNLIDDINWDSPTDRLRGYNEMINMTTENQSELGIDGVQQINKLGKSLLESSDAANLLGEAFEEFYNSSDFQDLSENMDKFVDSSGKLDSSAVMDMAEECGSLNNLLDTGAISAGGVAAALNALGSDGELVLSDLNAHVLELLSTFGQLDDIIASAHRSIENFDWGIDTGEAEDFVKESAEKWNELYNNGEVGNPQLEAYAKWVMGEERYTKLLAEKHGDLEATMAEVSKSVNLYSNGFEAAWDKLAEGSWENVNFSDDLKDLGISVSFDKNGDWNFDPGKATTEQLQKWLEQALQIGPEMAQAMIEDWSNYSPDFRAERQKNDFNAGLENGSYLEGRKNAAGGISVTQSELDTLSAATGQSVEDIKAAIIEQGNIQKDQLNVLQNTTKDGYSTNYNALNKELSKDIYGENAKQNAWANEYLKEGTKNIIDVSAGLKGLVDRGYTQQQAQGMMFTAFQNAQKQGKQYEYNGEIIDPNEVKTLDQFVEKMAEIDQNAQWTAVGEAIAQGYLSYIKGAENSENSNATTENNSVAIGSSSKHKVGGRAGERETFNYDARSAQTEARQNAQVLAQVGATNEQIKNSMTDAANKMAEAGMKANEIATSLNQSYGTNLKTSDVNIGENGKVQLNVDMENLQSQLNNITADVTANIVGISAGGVGRAGGGRSIHQRATGQNNPNSMFHRHGTMARGSRGGYTISGRPTLTGEEGEELVWEPKRNEAYMVGSNGPQFANISKDAVVWNAEQTRRIKKNSKVGSFGTGARGISHFGTMDGGNAGGLKIPGLLSVDATAAIQNVTPPTKEPTIPVKGKLEIEGNSGGALSKIKSALGGEKEKGGIVENISINLNSTIANPEEPKQKIEAAIPKKHEASVSTSITMRSTVDAGNTKQQIQKAAANSGKGAKANVKANSSQTINVNANTSAAQAKINKLISIFNKTYTLKYKANGPHSIKVPISANFTGSWQKTVTINKSGARGINNHIGYSAKPSFGSAAKGPYGTIGPKDKGGLTLTGEKGFEIAWLPSENRSMILGVGGPQMLNLPSDAVIYTHKQSEEILKRQSIDAGSHSKRRRKGSSGGSSKKKGKKNKKKSKSKDKSKGDINNFSIQEVVRFNIDKNLTTLTDQIEKRTKTIEQTLAKIGTRYKDIVGNTKAQISALEAVKNKNQALYNSYAAQLKEWRGQKEKVSYTDSKGKSHDMTFKVSSYVNANGSINQAAIAKLSTRAQREAVFKAVSSQAKTLTDGMNSAKKAIDDAQQKIDDLGKKISEAFYQWESELTEVYDLTQRINDETSFTDRFTSQIALELSKLNAGFGDTAQSIQNARNVLLRNNKIIKDQIANQQQMIAARQRELNAALSYQDEVNKLNKFKADTSTDAATKKANIEWAQGLANGAILGNKYVKNIFKDIDGSLQYTIDWAQFNKDNEANPYSKDTYEAIKKYLDELNDAAKEFNDSIKTQTDFIKDTYDALKEYQDYIVDMEDTLIKGVEEEIENAKDNAKRISDSITDALKDLLDEVKRKLDERRQQEDNAKTERDISQKQQRLAMLRANTAGGNQVEIAQLEKEIAESQQSYQRTLEDQLLDRLQQQADEASEQRERQIELMETSNQIDASTNKELVDMWLKDPEKYKEEIKAAWLEAQGYEDKGEAGQYVLEQQFESDFAQLVTAVEESNFKDNFNTLTANTNSLVSLLNELTNGQLGRADALAHSINALLDATDRNTTSILTELQKDNSIASLKAKGVEAQTLKAMGYTAKDLIGENPDEPIYSIAEMKAAGYTAKDIKAGGISDTGKLKSSGFNAGDLKNAGFSFADLLKNFTPTDLKKAGFDANTFGANNISYANAKAAGWTKEQLVNVNQYRSQAQAEINAEKAAKAKAQAAAAAAAKKATGNAAHPYGMVSNYSGNIKYGQKGNQVKAVQNALNKIMGAKLAVDGDFGKKTQAAVKQFQKKYKLTVDGVVGNQTKKKFKALGYKTGGLADYTGPAWLDGTPSKPELVLNAKDTKNFLALKDVLSKAMSSTGAVENTYGGDAMYEININVDKIEKDYDVDRVIEKVKKEITKGAGYRNVTQVRNFR